MIRAWAGHRMRSRRSPEFKPRILSTNSPEAGAAGKLAGFPAPPDVVLDFVIVGAPKCGTTALFAYLSTHPGIVASARKESFFWSTDVGSRDKVTDPGAYSRLWDG